MVDNTVTALNRLCSHRGKCTSVFSTACFGYGTFLLDSGSRVVVCFFFLWGLVSACCGPFFFFFRVLSYSLFGCCV